MSHVAAVDETAGPINNGTSALSTSGAVPKRLKTAICPFCAEEVIDGAIRCKHCRSDLTKECPSCKEQIRVHASKCRRCGADASLKATLPFAPIPGARPTSGVVFFMLALVILFCSLVLGPFGPLLVVVCTSIWVASDASTHKLSKYDNNIGGPATACVGSLLLWIVAFPWYLAIRSRIRAGLQPVKA
jgi:Double zinc ribbon